MSALPWSDLRERALRLGALADLWLADLAAQLPLPLPPEDFLRRLQEAMGWPADLRSRVVPAGERGRALVVSLDRLVDQSLLDESVLKPLLQAGPGPLALPVGEQVPLRTVAEAAEHLARGRAVVVLEAPADAWAVDVGGFEHRPPSEPDLEPSIRGDREGLVEVLAVNVATLRRRMATARLRVEQLQLGRLSRTRVAMVYVAGRADPAVVAEVRRRLHAAPWDAIYSAQQVESLLEDRAWSLFPQVRATERPDVCTGALHEGRVVVLTEGSPFALIVPTFFWDLLQTPDDYHLRWVFGVMLRILRLAAALLMLVVLPVYVAVTTFHQELIPAEFFLTLAAAREGIPVPTVVEALGLSLAFDLLREASTRLPKQVGGALSIVGALVVGESAVRGGFVSAPMVILIGLAALSVFALPAFATTMPFRMLAYDLILLGGTLGLVGVSFGLILVLSHMASLTTLGRPFLAPVAPFAPAAQEDVLIRLPYGVQAGPPPLVASDRLGREG